MASWGGVSATEKGRIRRARVWLYRWFKKYGFAVLVLIAVGGACYLAASVDVPDPAPDFALKSRQVYRLEIGGIFFAVFYLVALTFVLALSGRGFAQVGTQGFKAEKVVVDQKQNTVFHGQRRINRTMRDGLADLRAGMRTIDETLSEHQKQLDRLKEKRKGG
jgi:hypothetical protein